MRISVAMAVRNGEDYMSDLLDSLARQTRPPHEFVVYDDASDDSTPERLREFSAAAGFPVRIERGTTRVGHVEGFERAARLCQGDAVAFCDHDDVWLPEKLERCAAALEKSGAQLVLHAVRVVDAELRDLGELWPAIDADRLVPPLGPTELSQEAPGMAMVFRRSVLELVEAPGRPISRYHPDRPMLHDEFLLFLAGALGSIQLVAQPLVLYRQHEANDSGGWFQSRRQVTLAPVLDHYRQAAAHTRECARFLADARAADAVAQERLTEAARHYARMARNWEVRTELYGSPARATRSRLLWRLLAGRAYAPRSAGGLGASALAKDVVGGVLLARR